MPKPDRMKNLIWPYALALAATACQQQAPPAQAVAPVEAHSAAAAPAPARAPNLPPLFAAADTLTAPMRELLRQHNLAALWQNDTEERRSQPAMEGFFGPDHYRFALVFNEVRRDEQHPELYHVRGKCRYRRNIRPFSGTLVVRQIKELPDEHFLESEGLSGEGVPAALTGKTYTARARLQLLEKQAENSGVFEGEAVLDFYITPAQKQGYVTSLTGGVDETTPTRGSGLLVRGKRLNVSTKQVKSFVVAGSAIAAAPDVYKDFAFGDRSEQINPKYAKLGWDELWANDEWWVDAPTPSLNF